MFLLHNSAYRSFLYSVPGYTIRKVDNFQEFKKSKLCTGTQNGKTDKIIFMNISLFAFIAL